MIYKKLNNGIEIPALGLGTYKITEQKQVRMAVEAAFNTGYRLFDTAAIYGNHTLLAKAFKDLGIKREDIFITSKVWNTDHSYDDAKNAFYRALEELNTDYLDIYLIHWPGNTKSFVHAWHALEDLYKEGLIKAIGVSNFIKKHFEILFENSDIIPSINQIELHPYLVDYKLIEYHNKYDIAIESWAPILKGRVADDAILIDIGKKYGKSAVQVTIRWHLQNGFIVIPKSASPERIAENFNVFDFSLDQDDMKRIEELNKNYRYGPDPETFF